ncbi:RNA methyltransferase [Catenovulum sp. SM1970]|uniref:RNA methyltransferase n=1 Tax=Marinifaba aquimaris TaxID=2741323 RepID=UPI0015733B4F|nr:RNA methyltransferase [Marinifaba aquimaris]NTS77143.1 RNA methyltransferase [Marinifaba aquimaris]
MNQFACIGLFNPKSPQNVGTIMRAAGCYDVNSVFYTGRRYDKAREFTTDTKQVYQRIPLTGVNDLKDVIPFGAKPVAIELVEGATPLPDYRHPLNAFYVFGPEDGSLSQEVVDWCEDVVYIPTIGSMNLAATVNVLLYDRFVKLGVDMGENDALIKKSRDNNNRTKVK